MRQYEDDSAVYAPLINSPPITNDGSTQYEIIDSQDSAYAVIDD